METKRRLGITESRIHDLTCFIRSKPLNRLQGQNENVLPTEALIRLVAIGRHCILVFERSRPILNF